MEILWTSDTIHARLTSKTDAVPFRLLGLRSSAAAYLLQQLSLKTKTSFLVLCPTNLVAEQLTSDLVTLQELSTQPVSHKIILLPSWDSPFFSSVQPSISIRHQRIAALNQLALHPNDPYLIISDLQAATQNTIPHSSIKKWAVFLSEGASCGDRDQLISRFLNLGYLRNDNVEDPGVFSVRGDIIDIFIPGQDLPIRIDLFDDVVERIRHFDPETQKSLKNQIPKIIVPPAREVILNSETIPRLRSKLKEQADHLGVSRAVRDPVLDSIQSEFYPQHHEFWAEFAYPETEALIHYLEKLPQSGIIWYDEMGCKDEWGKFKAAAEKKFEPNETQAFIQPNFESLYPHAYLELCQKKSTLFLDQLQLTENTQPTFKVETTALSPIKTVESESLSAWTERLKSWTENQQRVFIFSASSVQAERLKLLLVENQVPLSSIQIKTGSLSESFLWESEKIVCLNESTIFGNKQAKKTTQYKKKKEWSGVKNLEDLFPGDFVVHILHGVGKYRGLVRLNIRGIESDYLFIEYASEHKLYLPTYHLNSVQKHSGSTANTILDVLGGQGFAKAKEKARVAAQSLATVLLDLYAKRSVATGFKFSPRDSTFREFEAKFPYDETPDQLSAIDDVLSDLESGKIMDRLVCGDVGFGKTEVAMRAAFRAAYDGKQVAVLVPTTILAAQHELSFKSRFKDYPFSIESISRFKSATKQKELLARLAAGKIDIMIGTHRLLSKDVEFKDLGLIIVDEEHRFGVEHKERLKKLKENIPVITLTATPIPRTLHLALSGLREISIIHTPPVNRLPIKTYVSKYDAETIKNAILFELSRGGQVFFLHNRVDTIYRVAEDLQKWIPSLRLKVAHGQMPETTLEKTMLEFYKKEFHLLLCTTIIESGLDIPSANTIIINRADHLGLAQLYQIRGRVGRAQERGHAYLLIPAEQSLSGDAKKRIEVLQRYVELGSGFQIASHDLEIRGGGNILGSEQSGHINAVGFDLFLELLDEAIKELKKTPVQTSVEPEIKIPYSAFLPDDYVLDSQQRLILYRRLSSCAQIEETTVIESELLDRFGPLPDVVHNLLWLIRIKVLLKTKRILALSVGPERASLALNTQTELDTVKIISLSASQPNFHQITPESKWIVKIQATDIKTLFFELEKILALAKK